VQVTDERGRVNLISIPAERPLTVYLDKRELVTLMTMGGNPEALVLGYLRESTSAAPDHRYRFGTGGLGSVCGGRHAYRCD
jgi:formate dehydrogenase assembly factor FdhD